MEDRADHRQRLGRRGEDLACSYLEGMGHVILERNWRCRHLEIDIISIDPDGIHFVEVKTRQKNVQAPPQENVNKAKQKRITSAALSYLKKSPLHRSMECFFDVAAITFEGEQACVEWIPQAFIPMYI